MKAEISESTHHDAKVRIQFDNDGYKSKDYDSLVRLVETTMGRFHTWSGVVEIAIEALDYMDDMRKGKPMDFGLVVMLGDGRHGTARQLDSHLAMDLQSSTCNVCFVGVTKLSIPSTVV